MQLDVLFLDIDGVLNPHNTKHRHVFAPECVAQLQRLLAVHPPLKIVFSTSWRQGTPFFVLGWLWRQHELPLPAILGRTTYIDPSRRGEEVRKWLADSKSMFPGSKVRRYAALDDETEMLLDELPREIVFACDPAEGLNQEVTDRLIQHFQA